MKIDWDSEEAKGCDYCLYNIRPVFIFCSEKPVIIDDYWDVDLQPFADQFSLHERPKKEPEIPEGATHKNIGGFKAFYYIKSFVWSVYLNGEWVRSENISEWFEENLTEIKQEKEHEIDYQGCEYAMHGNRGVYLFDESDLAKVVKSNEKENYKITVNKKIKQEKEMKENIYTKEMQEAGELTKVGMMCELNNNKYFYVGDDADGSHIFHKVGCIEYKSFHLGQVRGIDTRTDKEKAIDDLNEIIESYNKNSLMIGSEFSLGEWVFNDIDDNKIRGITFTGDK